MEQVYEKMSSMFLLLYKNWSSLHLAYIYIEHFCNANWDKCLEGNAKWEAFKFLPFSLYPNLGWSSTTPSIVVFFFFFAHLLPQQEDEYVINISSMTVLEAQQKYLWARCNGPYLNWASQNNHLMRNQKRVHRRWP